MFGYAPLNLDMTIFVDVSTMGSVPAKMYLAIMPVSSSQLLAAMVNYNCASRMNRLFVEPIRSWNVDIVHLQIFQYQRGTFFSLYMSKGLPLIICSFHECEKRVWCFLGQWRRRFSARCVLVLSIGISKAIDNASSIPSSF